MSSAKPSKSPFTSVYESVSVVVIGDFNPAIFQPEWFRRWGLLSDADVDAVPKNAESEFVVLPGVTSFATEWLSLDVRKNRFQVISADPARWHALRDLVEGTFRILEHTPIKSFGFNRYWHVKFTDASAWDRISGDLAPSARWQDGLEQDRLEEVHLGSLTMLGRSPGRRSDFVRVKIEPSNQEPGGGYLNVNEHFQRSLYDDGAADPTTVHGYLLRFLAESWDGFLGLAGKIFERRFAGTVAEDECQ